MKTYYKLFLALNVLIGWVACQDDAGIFDSSAISRLAETKTQTLHALTSAPNGWVMEFYPNEEKYGGYQLLVSFNADGTAVFQGEKAISGDSSVKEESLYQLKNENGILLSFDTYNGILHHFSDPQTDGVGMGSDYEFYVSEVGEEQVVLIGKKTHTRVVLQKMDHTDWNSYLAQIDHVVALSDTYFLTMTVAGDTVDLSATTSEGRNFTFSYRNASDSIIQAKRAFIFTPTGIRFKRSLSIEGVKIDSLNWNEEKNALFAQVDDTPITIKAQDLNTIFANSYQQWFFDLDTSSRSFKQVWNSVKYTMNSTFPTTPFVDIALGNYINPFEPERNYQCLIGVCGSSYTKSIFVFHYLPVADTDNQLTIEWSGYAMSASYYYKAYAPLLTYLSKADENQFILTADNKIKPTRLRFTKTTNANYYFEITSTYIPH